MLYCSVKYCYNRTYSPLNEGSPGFSSFGLPKDIALQKIWLKFAGFDENAQVSGRFRICMDHFDKQSFKALHPRPLLKWRAVPSLNGVNIQKIKNYLAKKRKESNEKLQISPRKLSPMQIGTQVTQVAEKEAKSDSKKRETVEVLTTSTIKVEKMMQAEEEETNYNSEKRETVEMLTSTMKVEEMIQAEEEETNCNSEKRETFEMLKSTIKVEEMIQSEEERTNYNSEKRETFEMLTSTIKVEELIQAKEEGTNYVKLLKC